MIWFLLVSIGFTKSCHWCSYIFHHFLWCWNFGIEWYCRYNRFRLSNLLKPFFWTLFFVEASKKYSDISYPKDAHKIEICFSIYRATGLSPGSKPGAERTRSPEAERCWTKWEIVGLCWANGKICLCNKVRIFSWFSIIYIYMHTCCWFFWIGYQQNKFLIFVVTI